MANLNPRLPSKEDCVPFHENVFELILIFIYLYLHFQIYISFMPAGYIQSLKCITTNKTKSKRWNKAGSVSSEQTYLPLLDVQLVPVSSLFTSRSRIRTAAVLRPQTLSRGKAFIFHMFHASALNDNDTVQVLPAGSHWSTSDTPRGEKMRRTNKKWSSSRKNLNRQMKRVCLLFVF